MPHPKPGRSAAPPAGSPRLGDARRRQRAGTGRICSVRSANDAGSLTDATKRIRAPVSTVTREKPSVPLSFN